MQFVQFDANADSDTITYVIPCPQPLYISGAVRPAMFIPFSDFPNGVRCNLLKPSTIQKNTF